MKILPIATTLLLLGCSSLERNDYLESKHIGTSSQGGVMYKLYQTGFDNYRYEFYVVDGADTTVLFKSYLNDATYQHVEFRVVKVGDTTFVKSNRNFGRVQKTIGKLIYVFDKE